MALLLPLSTGIPGLSPFWLLNLDPQLQSHGHIVWRCRPFRQAQNAISSDTANAGGHSKAPAALINELDANTLMMA